MAEDSSQYNPRFEAQAQGFAVGDNNIIYNYFGYREVLKPAPVDASDDSLPCPYRGLFHFGPNDAEYFFGRDVFVEKLFEATKTRHFIPVLGASGSGKSSVVLAGLVPKLEQEGHWRFTHFRPGSDPFHALALALVPLYRPELDATDEIIQARKLAKSLSNDQDSEDNLPLSDVFAKIEQNNPNHQILLIADQFEELYTQFPDSTVRRRFLDCLLTSFQSSNAGGSSSTILVTTMRADFLANALSYRPFADMLQNADIKLGAMSREELTEVIEKPAEKLGVIFEAGLVERILNDVEDEPGNLPLLEFALTELWEKRTGNILTHKAYENIGQIKGSLAKYAEQEYQKLKPNEQEQARHIFIQLVCLGENNNDTRRRVNRNQLGEDSWDLVTRKHGLADSRLVVTSRAISEQETLEIAHEALIRHWQQLRGWLDENRDALRKKQKIEEEAQSWVAHNKNKEYLWGGYRLAEVEKVLQEYAATVKLPMLPQEFLEESRRKELGSYLQLKTSDNLDQARLEKEAEDKSFLSKPRLWDLLKDEREDPAVRLAASWGLKQWGEEVPMWRAEIEEEEKISLYRVEPPPTVVEDLGSGISLELVEIEGGEFWMGASEEEEAYRQEFPQHKVRVSPFLIGKYPVTQAQWRAIVSLPEVERSLDLDPSYYQGDNRPVESVSWDDAVEFCKRLARETGKEYRLPTEAEWEYACRAGTTMPYHFGKKILPSWANYGQTARGETTPVGRFQVANTFGLYELYGNVYEWCEDDWHNNYEGAPTDGSAWIRRGRWWYWRQGFGNIKVIRGGCWCVGPNFCRSASRLYFTRDDRYDTIGFRVVCVAPRTT